MVRANRKRPAFNVGPGVPGGHRRFVAVPGGSPRQLSDSRAGSIGQTHAHFDQASAVAAGGSVVEVRTGSTARQALLPEGGIRERLGMAAKVFGKDPFDFAGLQAHRGAAAFAERFGHATRSSGLQGAPGPRHKPEASAIRRKRPDGGTCRAGNPTTPVSAPPPIAAATPRQSRPYPPLPPRS